MEMLEVVVFTAERRLIQRAWKDGNALELRRLFGVGL